MKRFTYLAYMIVLSVLASNFLSCNKISDSYLVQKNIENSEKNNRGLRTQDDNISVSFNNDLEYDVDVYNGGGFFLSMKVKFPPAYKIGSAYFEITEAGTLLRDEVGGQYLDESAFTNNSYSAQYEIYRGGNFQIIAVVDLIKIADNTSLQIYSEPMTMKANYPEYDEIYGHMAESFNSTWLESLIDPNRKEYGYYVYLKGKGFEQGTVYKGNDNNCDTPVNRVAVTGREESLNSNPTDPLAVDYMYFTGLFHTHPNYEVCSSKYGRNPVGESTEDTGNQPDFPAYVYDYDEPIKGGHSKNDPAHVYWYSTPRRDPLY